MPNLYSTKTNRVVRILPFFMVVAASALLGSVTHADDMTCGTLSNGFGPFDYRTAEASALHMVESYHFTTEVETLKAGKSGAIGGDLDYTLRAFPNHHRALLSLMNLRTKTKTDRPTGVHWSVECYFDRAIRFRPDDAMVHAIYGVFLLRLSRRVEAIKEFEQAESLGSDDANFHYNLGLAYFDVGDFDKAVQHAKNAYALGFQLPGLRSKLEKAGKWTTN